MLLLFVTWFHDPCIPFRELEKTLGGIIAYLCCRYQATVVSEAQPQPNFSPGSDLSHAIISYSAFFSFVFFFKAN